MSAFIACYGCAKYFHQKCVNIKAIVDGDVLIGTGTNGLQWFCTVLISTSRLFSKLQQYQKSADNISTLAISLVDMVVQHQSDAQDMKEVLCAINSTKVGCSDQVSVQLSSYTGSKSASLIPATIASSNLLLPTVLSDPVKSAPVSISSVPVSSVPSDFCQTMTF